LDSQIDCHSKCFLTSIASLTISLSRSGDRLQSIDLVKGGQGGPAVGVGVGKVRLVDSMGNSVVPENVLHVSDLGFWQIQTPPEPASAAAACGLLVECQDKVVIAQL